jgi:hypothetical protein
MKDKRPHKRFAPGRKKQLPAAAAPVAGISGRHQALAGVAAAAAAIAAEGFGPAMTGLVRVRFSAYRSIVLFSCLPFVGLCDS